MARVNTRKRFGRRSEATTGRRPRNRLGVISATDCVSNQDARSAPRRGEDRPQAIRINLSGRVKHKRSLFIFRIMFRPSLKIGQKPQSRQKQSKCH
jgi:hypothetical protein